VIETTHVSGHLLQQRRKQRRTRDVGAVFLHELAPLGTKLRPGGDVNRLFTGAKDGVDEVDVKEGEWA